MITIFRHTILLSLILSISCINNIPFAQSYHFHNYTIENGLPTDAVYGAMQDSEGYIWIFTEKGVSKFDGYEFKTFTMAEGLPSNDIWDLTEDSQGRIWLQTLSSKLAYIEKDSVKYIKRVGKNTLYPQTIFDVSGKIWFLDRNNYYEIIGDTLVKHKSPLLWKEPGITKLIENPLRFAFRKELDEILVFIDTKCYRIKNQEIIQTDIVDTKWSSKMIESSISSLKRVVFQKNYQQVPNLYFTFLSKSFGKWDDNKKEGISFLYEEKLPKQTNKPTVPIIYPQVSGFQVTYGNIFFTLDQDLNLMDTFQLNHLKSRRFFKDKESNLWIATESEGLFLLTANARNALTFNPNQKVLKVIGQKESIFYSAGNKIYKIEQEEGVTFFEAAIKEKEINGLTFDNLGYLYIGGQLETYKVNLLSQENIFKKEEWNNITLDVYTNQLFNIEGNLAIGNVKAFYWEQQRNNLWISRGMRFYKLHIADDSKLILKELPLRRVKSIVKATDNTLWIGGTNGLAQITNLDSIIKVNSGQHEILQEKIISLVADQDSLIWVGTEGLGVYGYDKNQIIDVPATKGLFISSLFKGTDNHLWVASNKGVQQIYINPNNPIDNRLIKTYTTNDGLASNETNDIYVDSQYLYVATNKGLTRINRQQRYTDNSAPKIIINNITINGKKQALQDNYDLSYQENELEISYTGLSYKSFKNLEYTYQLKGADNDWKLTTNREVRYSNLTPGTYTFRLKVTDIIGKEAKLKSPISFTIHPPYWQTNWFKGLILLGLLSLGYFFYRFRIGQIQKNSKVKQQFAELELQALRSQMNPHFVFNSLTSIQYFIQESDLEEADEYLAKFGKLMRLFLESSKTKYIPLAQEIRLLKAYIEMEQLRFEEKFKVEFVVDKNIEQHYLSVPSLLIQPFIENAINHGLFHKKEKGLLQVRLEKREAAIITVTLIDNGIGRKKANEIKKQSIRSYKSRGLQIVEERVEAINRTENINIQYTIEDLEDNQGIPLGTKVILQIPVSYHD